MIFAACRPPRLKKEGLSQVYYRAIKWGRAVTLRTVDDAVFYKGAVLSYDINKNQIWRNDGFPTTIFSFFKVSNIDISSQIAAVIAQA